MAIQTYPWNWVAIVDQEKDHHSGYYFGIDAQGRARTATLRVGNLGDLRFTEPCSAHAMVACRWHLRSPKWGQAITLTASWQESFRKRAFGSGQENRLENRKEFPGPASNLTGPHIRCISHLLLAGWNSRRTQDLQPGASGRGSRRHLSVNKTFHRTGADRAALAYPSQVKSFWGSLHRVETVSRSGMRSGVPDLIPTLWSVLPIFPTTMCSGAAVTSATPWSPKMGSGSGIKALKAAPKSEPPNT